MSLPTGFGTAANVRTGLYGSFWPQGLYVGRRKTAGQNEGDVIVTTIDHAAAMHARKPGTLAVFATIMALGLGGCETSSNLFGASGDAAAPAAVAQQAVPPAAPRAKIAVAPVIGPPDTAVKLVQAQLVSAIERQKISVAKLPTDPSEYTLRGYIVAAKEKAGAKMSYIWDVTDPAGKRVNRITGEEVVPGKLAGSDPWVALTPQVIEKITSKTATSVGAWLPTQVSPAAVPVASLVPAGSTALGAQAVGAPAVAGATPTAPALAALVLAAPAPVATLAPAAAAAATQVSAAAPGQTVPGQTVPGQTTGSIGSNKVTAMVQTVTGAPGDGSVSLTGAMQRALAAKGVALTEKPVGQTYRIQGKVAVGQAKDGKQPVQIEWVVTDPQGNQLIDPQKGERVRGITQNNEIKQGMLDGAWGQTADNAAGAAAEAISRLLRQQQAQASTGSTAPVPN